MIGGFFSLWSRLGCLPLFSCLSIVGRCDDWVFRLSSPVLIGFSGCPSPVPGKGDNTKDDVADRNPILRREKSGVTEPVIIPIVLKMAEFDHKALLEEWISSRKFSDSIRSRKRINLISNLKTIQDYLCSFKSQGLTVANISATTFPQTLDWLHNHLLQCIEQGMPSASKGSGGQTGGS